MEREAVWERVVTQNVNVHDSYFIAKDMFSSSFDAGYLPPYQRSNSRLCCCFDVPGSSSSTGHVVLCPNSSVTLTHKLVRISLSELERTLCISCTTTGVFSSLLTDTVASCQPSPLSSILTPVFPNDLSFFTLRDFSPLIRDRRREKKINDRRREQEVRQAGYTVSDKIALVMNGTVDSGKTSCVAWARTFLFHPFFVHSLLQQNSQSRLFVIHSRQQMESLIIRGSIVVWCNLASRLL